MILSLVGSQGRWDLDDPADVRILVRTQLLAGVLTADALASERQAPMRDRIGRDRSRPLRRRVRRSRRCAVAVRGA